MFDPKVFGMLTNTTHTLIMGPPDMMIYPRDYQNVWLLFYNSILLAVIAVIGSCPLFMNSWWLIQKNMSNEYYFKKDFNETFLKWLPKKPLFSGHHTTATWILAWIKFNVRLGTNYPKDPIFLARSICHIWARQFGGHWQQSHGPGSVCIFSHAAYRVS